MQANRLVIPIQELSVLKAEKIPRVIQPMFAEMLPGLETSHPLV